MQRLGSKDNMAYLSGVSKDTTNVIGSQPGPYSMGDAVAFSASLVL